MKDIARALVDGRRWRRAAFAVVVIAAPALFVPAWWCGRDADRFFTGESGLTLALARHVADRVRAGVSPADFNTGSSVFNGEWAFGTYQMAALGLLQVLREHPETRREFLPVVDLCFDRILAPGTTAFDRRSWGEEPLETLEGDKAHAAYLGYFNVALGLHRRLVPDSRFAPLHDRITAALHRRLERSLPDLLETYPGETYPVDNCAVAGSIALHGLATGADHRGMLERWTALMRQRYVHRASGLLYQAASGGRGTGDPRASHTALGLYFLALGGIDLAPELYAALSKNGFTSFMGFGLVREYPPGVSGSGDIDSGPVLFGIGFSATGFSLAGCRIFGTRDDYRAMYRTAHLVGSPLDSDGRRDYVFGGPLGNAILLAMLSAPRAQEQE